jgi:hypothetical protein
MLLTKIWYYPIVWWVIVPVSAVLLFVGILVWESWKGKVKINHPDHSH